MVHGANKSGSRKRIDVRTTSATTRRFIEKRPSKPHSMRGAPLSGTARGTKADIKKTAKTQRRPNRPFGGVMDSKELREYYKAQARLSSE